MGSTEVIVGAVGRAHGIRGEVSVDPRTDEPERRFAVGASLRDEASRRPLTVTSARWHAERLLVCFREVTDRTAAESLKGVMLVTDVDEAETPDDPEEFYDRHLVGLEVRTAHGARVGEVSAVLHRPAQDLLSVSTEAGERLIPFTHALVPRVEVAEGWCEVADVPGLLDDAQAEVAAAP